MKTEAQKQIIFKTSFAFSANGKWSGIREEIKRK